MLRLGETLSDSQEVLVDKPVTPADDDVILSSIPEAADVGVTSPPTTTTRDAAGTPPAELKLGVVEASSTSCRQRTSSVANGSSCIEVAAVPATPIRTAANTVRTNLYRQTSNSSYYSYLRENN